METRRSECSRIKLSQAVPAFKSTVALIALGLICIGLSGCAPPLLSPAAPAAPIASLPPGPNWQLAFGDEFDQPVVDTHKWDTCFYFVDNIDGAPGCTQDGLANVFRADDVLPQADGTLLLRAQKRSGLAYGRPYTYTTGMLSSFGHYSFQYGYAEIRLKATKGRGLWDAFWLMPASKKWTAEIDVLEILGHETNVVHTTLHYTSSKGDVQFTGQPFAAPVDLAKDFHTYAINWTKDSLTWYVDGVETARQTEHIPQEPMYLIATMAVGDAASWSGAPDATTSLPSHIAIDYIRVYQRKP